jgi:hypothetical protein
VAGVVGTVEREVPQRRELSRPQELWWIGAPGSLHGQAFGVDNASNGTVCVSSAEDKEP